jgi:hypothetical protein
MRRVWRFASARPAVRGLRFESLESRELLAADYGDAASSSGSTYATASHEAIGPKLGVLRDANPLVTNTLANGDASDEDGVRFGLLRAGESGAMTVLVTDAPAGARLYAAIDFNRDGDWIDAGELIAFNQPVTEGDHLFAFEVPSTVAGGHYYARVRLSTASNLGPSGAAPDGEVEDYLLPIAGAESSVFGGEQAISFDDATLAVPADLDGDGDVDLLTSRMTWHRNSNGFFGAEQPILSATQQSHSGTAVAFAPADVDGDGDLDFFASLSSSNQIAWLENIGAQRFTLRTIDSAIVTGALAPIDFDGDGDLDLVAGGGSEPMRWYANDGTQNFTKTMIVGSPAYVESLSISDMDGDGDFDVITAAPRTDTIKWLENDGQQQFTLRDVAAPSASLEAIATADLDGDGDLDVLAAFSASGGIVWYENDGDQTFTPRSLEASAWTALALAAADLDGDGDLDVAAAGNNRVVWYENDGDDTLAVRQVASSFGPRRAVTPADVDGDGRLDLVTAGTFSAPTALFSQLAVYDFGDAPAPYHVYRQQNGARHNETGPRLGATRDAEEDGARAPAGAEAEDDGVVFGAISLSESTGAVTVNVQNAPAGAKLDAWIDFDGDGSWGIAGEQIAASEAVVEGDNVITFSIPSWAVAGATYARFRLSSAGGLGPDGTALDGEVEDHAVEIADRAPATGLFGEPQLVASGASNMFAAFMATADVDGDGDVDVVAKAGLGFAWYENQGAGGFLTHLVPPPSTSTRVGGEDIAVGDLDNDGDVDFIGFGGIVGNPRSALVWAENDGAQNFTIRTWLLPTNFVNVTFVAMTIVDLDADGDMDVLASSLGTGVYILVNNGAQDFTPTFVGHLGSLATSVVAADMDHDGDLDVVAGGVGGVTNQAGTNFYDVVWFQNNGGLSFTWRGILRQPTGLSKSGAIESVAVGDIDGDGDLDVVSAGAPDTTTFTNSPTLWWHEQTADQTFVSHTISFERAYRWATLADFDVDGDLDVVASGYGNYPTDPYPRLDFYENLGDNRFAYRALTTAVGPGWTNGAADMDGDGDLDVVGLGILSSTGIAWLENKNLVDPDYGDAPASYRTTRARGGAVHNGVGPRLGSSRTSEADGVPTPNADGDSGDDGVTFSPIRVGQALGTVVVNVQNAPAGAKLDAWIDFNGDGSWGGAGEQIAVSYEVVDGDNVVTFNVPANVVAGTVVARFRLSTAGALRPVGAALDGEVEDHLLVIASPGSATGEFQIGATVGSAPQINSAAQSIYVADIDGDGDADYLATNSGGPVRLAWYENLGDGAFLMHVRGLLNAPTVWNARPLDLDGDGDVDFALVVSNGIGWLENDGSQNFTYRAATSAGNNFSGVVDFADVDGDGDLDALAGIASISESSLQILINDGQQRFTAGAKLTTLTVGVSAVRAADVDGDGDVDFAAAFEGGGSTGGIAWYENAGSSWIFHDVSGIAPSDPRRAGRDVVPIDFDLDGDVDLVASAYSANLQLSLDVYRNDGNENFVRETLATIPSSVDAYSSQARGSRLQVADLDGDGDYDAATAAGRNVRVYLNEGQAGFVQATYHQFISTAAATLAVGDLDGDGRLELIAANGFHPIVLLDDLPFGDYDRNGTVDQADRDLYEATLGQPAVPPGSGADGDRSGVVDEADLAVWEANQGAAPPPLVRAADIDQNEVIDGADFLAWQRAFGATSTVPGVLSADVDYSAAVDGGDLAVWMRQYGQGVAPPVSSVGAAALSVETSSSLTVETSAAVDAAQQEPTPIAAALAPEPALDAAAPAARGASAASRFTLPASVVLAPTAEPKSAARKIVTDQSQFAVEPPRDAAFALLAPSASTAARRPHAPATSLDIARVGAGKPIPPALLDELLTRLVSE